MPPTNNDSAKAGDRERDDQREVRLLAQLANAQDLGVAGKQRVGRLTAELLMPYWAYILRVARWKLHTTGATATDIEDVAGNVVERMVRALENTTQFRKPLKYVVLDNIDWACADFRRQRRRRAAEVLLPPGDMPPPSAGQGRKRSATTGRYELIATKDGDEGRGLAAQAKAFRERIDGLSGRDREIVMRRFFAGVAPAEIARELGIGRGALDTATHRALRKLLASEPLADVRDAPERLEGEGT
jgi:RNA polymerase sigma factor (sigma-70 family)